MLFWCGVVVDAAIVFILAQSKAIAIFIIGWFIFPVWWFACCGICAPGTQPLAKILNIVSTVLGLVWLVWVPIALGFVIAGIIAAANIIHNNTGNYYFYYYRGA